MEPLELNVSKLGDKETISILWSDGHKSNYDAFSLRSSCPCAMCQGEPGIFGRTYASTKSRRWRKCCSGSDRAGRKIRFENNLERWTQSGNLHIRVP